ncbi:MAG: hypothetical protein J0H00_10175 [Burkholderiales bacterium]|nr:hypothetical protein [Burkholderiales bacterium]OJX06648.1 MAG: hypothetical protein BGO72_16765 [Burkholderiales bacterium 70-64]
MVMTYDGFVCLSADLGHYGFVLFREPARGPGPVEWVCSQWAWPPTQEGRAAAQRQMDRTVERLQLEARLPSMRAQAVIV